SQLRVQDRIHFAMPAAQNYFLPGLDEKTNKVRNVWSLGDAGSLPQHAVQLLGGQPFLAALGFILLKNDACQFRGTVFHRVQSRAVRTDPMRYADDRRQFPPDLFPCMPDHEKLFAAISAESLRVSDLEPAIVQCAAPFGRKFLPAAEHARFKNVQDIEHL